MEEEHLIMFTKIHQIIGYVKIQLMQYKHVNIPKKNIIIQV